MKPSVVASLAMVGLLALALAGGGAALLSALHHLRLPL